MTTHIEEFKALLRQETVLFESFSSKEKEIQATIGERRWHDLEAKIAGIQELATAIGEVEERRHEAYLALRRIAGVPEDAGFYQLLFHFPIDDREEIADRYRNLKLALLRVQGVTAGLDAYLVVLTKTVKGVLDEIFPFRKAKTYSKRGDSRPGEEKSLLVNEHL